MNEIDNNWRDGIEVVVDNIRKQSTTNKHLHIKYANTYMNIYNILTVAGVILGPVTSMLTTINNIHKNEYLTYTIVSLGMCSGIIMSAIKFGKYDELCNTNKKAASVYLNIQCNIQNQLLLDKHQRTDACEYLEWLQTKFNDAFCNSPLLPEENMRDDDESVYKDEQIPDRLFEYEFQRFFKHSK